MADPVDDVFVREEQLDENWELLLKVLFDVRVLLAEAVQLLGGDDGEEEEEDEER